MPTNRRTCVARASIAVAVLLAAAPAGAAEPADPRPAAGRVAAYSRAVRQEVLRPDRCPYRPASVVMALGPDPALLASFVRESIAYEPCAGSVRGAAGALAAGAAGDWDRAELLRALLSEAGWTARLVPVERTPAEADAAVLAFRSSDPRRRTVSAGVDLDETKIPPALPLLARFGIPEGNRLIHARRGAARWRCLLEEAIDAGAPEAGRVEEALAAAGLAGFRGADAWTAALAAGTRERVLVEIGGGSDGVSILSPGPEEGTLAPDRLDAAPRLESVPEEKIARLGLRLVLVPAVEGGDGEPAVLLDWSEVLASLVDRPVRLEIVPVDEKAAARSPARWTAKEWSDHVRGFRQFQAILRAGGTWTASKVFDLQGAIHDVAADGRVAGSAEAGGAVRRGFGDAFGGGESAPEPAGGIRSLVLALELRLPGEEPVRQERLLLGDLRPDGTPIITADLLVAPGPIGPAAAAWLALDAVTANAPTLEKIVLGADPGRLDDPPVTRYPAMLHEWQLGRLGLADRALAADPGLSFLGGSAAALQVTQVVVEPDRKAVRLRVALDVAFDRSVLVPRGAGGEAAAARANLALGAASTVLESAILRRRLPDGPPRGARAESIAARLEGIEARAVLAGADGSTPGVAPAPLAAWAIARNDSARAVVLPRPAGGIAWWSVDPQTGAMIGRGGPGEGQSAMEYLQVTKWNLSNLKCMLGFAQSMLAGGRGDPKVAAAWMACVTGMDNPGGPMGAAGNTAGVLGYEATGGFFAQAGDALGGAIDAASLLEGGK